MRLFALSDVHVDYDTNARWLADLSLADYRDDLLILAGDVSDTRRLLEWGLCTLTKRFKRVFFVPGNHDLWVIRDSGDKNSLQKFDEVCAVVEGSGASMRPGRERGVSIMPLLAWYDYSFGQPGDELQSTWLDYRCCRWPRGFTEADVAAHFLALNDTRGSLKGDVVITYSHFLPRLDVLPGFKPGAPRPLYPVLGSTILERQLRRLQSTMHVYGHSHINRRVMIDGVAYINSAFGYPHETRFASKQLTCIYEW
jgi:predicted phosphodiesterase